MTVDELLAAVRAMGRDDLPEDSLRQRLEAALTTGSGAFVAAEGGWRLRTETHSELNDLAYAYLAEQGKPAKFGDILRHLQGVTRRSRGDLMSRVDLDGDWRFARLESGEWVLTDWSLEQVEAQTTDHETQVRNVGSNETEGEENMVTGTGTEQVVQQTIRIIQEQLRRLRQREEEISQEALQCFYREDLPGIERLMGERRMVVSLIAKLEDVATSLPASEEATVGAP
jgi:DNA-directed RNA polymerase delta subunit